MGSVKGLQLFDNQLELHRTKLAGADAFYDKHVGTLLTPPGKKELTAFPKLVRHEFTIDQKMDIVFLVWDGFVLMVKKTQKQ